jgi:hypothetical protein
MRQKGTYKLDDAQRTELEKALLEKHNDQWREAINNVVTKRFRIEFPERAEPPSDMERAATETQLNRILRRGDDKLRRNGVLSASWKRTLVQVLDEVTIQRLIQKRESSGPPAEGATRISLPQFCKQHLSVFDPLMYRDLLTTIDYLGEPFDSMKDVGPSEARPTRITTLLLETPNANKVGYIKAQAIGPLPVNCHGTLSSRPWSSGHAARQAIFCQHKGETKFVSSINQDDPRIVPVEIQGSEVLLVLACYPKPIVLGDAKAAWKIYQAWNAVEVNDFTRRGPIEYLFAVGSPNKITFQARYEMQQAQPGSRYLEKTKLPVAPSESKLNEAIAWVAKLVQAALQTSSFPEKSKSPYALNRRDCESPPYCEAFKLLFEFTARKRNTIIKWTSDNHMSQSNDVFYATSTER